MATKKPTRPTEKTCGDCGKRQPATRHFCEDCGSCYLLEEAK